MKSLGDVIEEPLEIDYEVVPYSPTENSKTAQIKKITQFMELLLATPHVDQRKLIEHILDTLDIGVDVLVPPEQAAQIQQQQAQAQQAEEGGGAAPPAPSADNMAAGGMPPGVEEVPAPALDGMAGGAGHPTPTPGGF